MRNLKISFTLLCLLALFGCQTNDSSLDETPSIDNIRSAPGSDPGQGTDPPFEKSLTAIAIQFPFQYDKVQFRIDHGPTLGLSSFVQCSSDPNREVWFVDELTPTELFVILLTIFPVVEPPSSNSNGDGGLEGYAEPYNSNTTFPVIKEVVVRFYYEGTCD